jgi:hypothetical protein
MSTSTGLAAVAAATTTNITQAQLDAAIDAARAEGLAAGKAEGEKAGQAAGAKAERERILGIEAHAIAGHEKLIATCKADPDCTPDMAAGRILAAEKKLRDDQMAGIRNVEEETGKVGHDASSQRRDGGAVTMPKPGVQKSAEAHKADWEKSADLKRDFASADSYANYAAGIESGRIRELKRPA